MSRPKQGNTNQATKTSETGFDFAKWKPTAQRKWANYNVSVQFKKLVTAWKTGTNVQECANDLLDRLNKALYRVNDNGPGADLQRMAIGKLKPTLTAASSRGLPPGTTDYLQVTGDRDDLKTKRNTDAEKGASGGMKERNPHDKETRLNTEAMKWGMMETQQNHLDLQTKWLTNLLLWLKHSFEKDDERRIQQPEIPNGLDINYNAYTYIQTLAAAIHIKIAAISTPDVHSVTKFDQATETSVEAEENLKKSERKQFENEISSMKKELRGIDTRVSKLLTSLESDEEIKKGNGADLTATHLNGKIDKCQHLVARLRENCRGIDSAVAKAYTKFVVIEEKGLHSVTDQIKCICDVLTKQEKSLKIFYLAEEEYARLSEYCEDLYHLSSKLNPPRDNPPRVPRQRDTLHQISNGLGGIIKYLGACVERTTEQIYKVQQENADIKRKMDSQEVMIHGLNGQGEQLQQKVRKIDDGRNELPSRLYLAEEEYDRLRHYCEDLYNLSSKLQVNAPIGNRPRVPSERGSLQQISHALGGIIQYLGTCIESSTEQIDKVQQENADIKRKMDSQQVMIHGLNDQGKQLQQEVRNIEDERNELLCRLSKFASAKLTLNNPNITDLSDTDRPIKLAERYSELYDNEWTDAFQALTDKLEYDERNAIDTLLDIITGVSQYCATIGQRQQMNIRMAISYPASRGRDNREHVKLPDHHGKTVADIVKDTADISEKDLLSTYILQGEHVPTCDPNVLAQKECRSYRDRCVNLCWKMALQNPPVYLEGTLKERSTFDTKLYKPYQTTGKKVAYLIWPALFLHQGGTLLMKGVAEGMKK